MKPFQHYSATAVTSFRLCQRKWYLNKIVGMELPVTQALEDGRRYAEEAEFYFKSDNPAGLSAVTRPLVALVAAGRIPAPRTRPGSVLRVEHPLSLRVSPGGLRVSPGGLDVDGTPAEGYMDLLDLQPRLPVVWDQKTTKSKRYVKEVEQLRNDVQMVLYAKATVLQHESVYGYPPDAVGVAHIALLKPPESPEAIIVGPTFLDLEHIEAQWQGIKSSVRAMKVVALLPSPDKVTPSWTACGAFGGCPYRDTCQSLKTMSQTQGLPKMSMLKNLIAAREAGPTAPPTTAPVVESGQKHVMGIAQRIAASMVKPGQVTPPDAPASTSLAGISAGLQVAPVVPAVLNVASPARNPAVVAAEDAAAKLRAPRNGDKRLTALGWDDYAISCMSVERKHAVLDQKLKPDLLADNDSDAPAMRDWNLGSNEALVEGARLGWSEEAMNDMSDEVFGAILTESKPASQFTVTMGGNRIVATPAAVVAPVVVAPVVVAPVVVAPVVVAALVIPREERVVIEKIVPPLTALTLLIGCRPSKGMQYRELGDILAPAMREIEAIKKVTYWDLLPYNEGGKLLAASVLLHPVTGVVCVDPAAPYANAVLAVLLPTAGVVVRS